MAKKSPPLPKCITVKVTEDNIADGIEKDQMDCPIGIAIRDARGDKNTKDPDFIAVSRKFAMVRNDVYVLPPEAKRFIIAFDGRKKVKPFTFKMCKVPG